MWYPPEPYFTHPIAKAVAEQMKNKDKLSIILPSHHHTHNYVLHSNSVMCVVVGEAQSGTDYRAELDKCLPGICKSLNIMHYGIAITSSQMKSSVHLGHVGGILIHRMKPVQSLMIDSITVNKQGGEDKYGAYIDKLLDVLEIFVSLHVASDIFVKGTSSTLSSPRIWCQWSFFSLIRHYNPRSLYGIKRCIPAMDRH